MDKYDFIMTYPSIQTASGTSGAPIVLWTYQKGKKHPVGSIIGVHNGFDEDKKANSGTYFMSYEGLNKIFDGKISNYLKQYDFENQQSHPQYALQYVEITGQLPQDELLAQIEQRTEEKAQKLKQMQKELQSLEETKKKRRQE